MKYDLLVIGAGPGGYVCAIRAAQLGLKTAVAERRETGGTCLNRGCIPAKTLLHSAELYRNVLNGAKFGITAENPKINVEKVFERKNEVSAKLREGINRLFKANKIDFYSASAKILGEGKALLSSDGEEEIIECKSIVIATGSAPALIPVEGADLDGVLTSDGLLQMNDRIPEKLVIIGGGVIGMEFAEAYSAFGSEVTIIEAMPEILPMMDKDISRNLSVIMKKRGVNIHTSASVNKIEKTDEGLCVHFSGKTGEKTAVCDTVLIAAGRKANTEGLFGEGVNILTERGRILTDENMMTNINNIYAIGDVTMGIQFAHAASAQGIFAAEHIAGKKSCTDLSVIPSCVYTSPEIASVGLTESEAKKKGISVKKGKFMMSANGRALINDDERGFVKVIFDSETGCLKGAQLMCSRATDMVGELAGAIANKMTAEQLLKAVKAHPTFSEAIAEAIEDSMGRAVHVAPKIR